MSDSHDAESIFFATAFSGNVDDNGLVKAEFRKRMEHLLAALRRVGFDVYCSLEADSWRISQRPAGESMAQNFKNIDSRERFLALVDKVGSDGRGIEIEHACSNGKNVILATGPAEELGWVMQEIVALGRARHIVYEKPDELARAIAALYAN